MATTPYPFVAGAVLTASQLNSTFNVPINAQTASYVLVASDAGKRVQMSNAGATTITVNTSLFSAGDSLFIQNIGAGTCTITAGTATVTTAGSLALAQWGGGTLYFTSASAAIFFPFSGGTPALVRTGGGTLSGTTTAFANVFSATYNNYFIVLSNIASVTADQWIQLTMTGATSGYYFGANTVTYAGTTSFLAGANAASFQYLTITGSAKANGAHIQIQNPFLSKETTVQYQTQWTNTTNGYSIAATGFLNNTTSYTGFTLTSASGNFSGTVNVYGLALS